MSVRSRMISNRSLRSAAGSSGSAGARSAKPVTTRQPRRVQPAGLEHHAYRIGTGRGQIPNRVAGQHHRTRRQMPPDRDLVGDDPGDAGDHAYHLGRDRGRDGSAVSEQRGTRQGKDLDDQASSVTRVTTWRSASSDSRLSPPRPSRVSSTAPSAATSAAAAAAASPSASDGNPS